MCFSRKDWDEKSAQMGAGYSIDCHMGVLSDDALRRAKALYGVLFSGIQKVRCFAISCTLHAPQVQICTVLGGRKIAEACSPRRKMGEQRAEERQRCVHAFSCVLVYCACMGLLAGKASNDSSGKGIGKASDHKGEP